MKFENFNNKRNTPFSLEVLGFLNLLYTVDIIPKISINADFMNKYRPDLLWNEYKLGCGKSYTRLKAHFKDLERNDKKWMHIS